MQQIAVAAMLLFVVGSALTSCGHGAAVFGFLLYLPGEDRTGHFLIFSVLSLIMNVAFAPARVAGRRMGVVRITALVLFVATLEEGMQRFLPERMFDLVDLAASVAGTLVGAVAAVVVLSRRARPRTKAR